MRDAGPPWSSPSQNPYGYQPQSSGDVWSTSPDDTARPTGSSYPLGTDDYRPVGGGSPWGDGEHRDDARPWADREHGDDGERGDSGGGRHSGSGRRTGDRGRARPPRRRVARLATTTAVVVGLAAATGLVGFLARSSSTAQSAAPTSGFEAAGTTQTTTGPTSAPAAKSTSTGTVSAGSPPAGLGTNWKLTFNTDFTGSKLDPAVWGTCYPWQSQSGCANFGNSSLEYQWYAASQDQVSNGALHLVAQAEPTTGLDGSGAPETYPYRSGLVTTFPGYNFQYGYLQVVARVPDAAGTWSALWLAASNKKWPPEIDILEHWDSQTKYYEYYHPAGAPRENGVQTLGNLSTSYHTYGVYWTQSRVIWYIDGHPVFETGRNVPQQPMYFLANVAIDEHVSSLNTSMDIKSVSVWQQGG